MTFSQQQFLNVINRDEAEQRFQAAIQLDHVGEEMVDLKTCQGRVLARDILSSVDVPSFDRSNYDGYAVKAADTFGARDEDPRKLRQLTEVITTAIVPTSEIVTGSAVTIATGGMLPRGADAIVMIEHADLDDDLLVVRKAVTPGFGITFAGTDISAGETVLRRGELLTSRETGVLAAVGTHTVPVLLRPRVAIISTGDEIIDPTETMQPGLVYDSNARILADAVRELGGEPVSFGIVHDNEIQLEEVVRRALASCHVVLLSGGTSKGAGDLSYQVIRQLKDPGIVAHGVALKPGKPICLAATQGKPVVILPGFPTSAIFTFHEFVAPVISRLAGRAQQRPATATARMAVRVNSEIGRTEYLLVGLVQRDAETAEGVELSAYPMGKGSGSVTTFSRADGFITIGRHDEIIPAGTNVNVCLLGKETRVADLVVIGSHCVGLDFLLGQLQDAGIHTKFLAVGSTAGLDAARRGECDLAGIHLLDAKSGTYNHPFITADLTFVAGYRRQQGVVFRPGDTRFSEKSAAQAIQDVMGDEKCVMINRNRGSGTRILIDQALAGIEPAGYAVQARNHNAVAAAISQNRADWGVAIQSVAEHQQLGFLPLADEQYDFVSPASRSNRSAVVAFQQLLNDPELREQLAAMGLRQDLADHTS